MSRPKETRTAVEALLRAGVKPRDITLVHDVSYGFVMKVKRDLAAPTNRKCELCGAQVPAGLHFLCLRCYKSNTESTIIDHSKER